MERFTGGVIGIAEIPLGPAYSILQKQAQSMKAFGSEPTSQQLVSQKALGSIGPLVALALMPMIFPQVLYKFTSVKSNGTITFAHTLAADATTEGIETSNQALQRLGENHASW